MVKWVFFDDYRVVVGERVNHDVGVVVHWEGIDHDQWVHDHVVDVVNWGWLVVHDGRVVGLSLNWWRIVSFVGVGAWWWVSVGVLRGWTITWLWRTVSWRMLAVSWLAIGWGWLLTVSWLAVSRLWLSICWLTITRLGLSVCWLTVSLGLLRISSWRWLSVHFILFFVKIVYRT